MSIKPLSTAPTVPTPVSPIPIPQQSVPPLYVTIIAQPNDDKSSTDTPQPMPRHEYNLRSHAHEVSNLVIHMVPPPIKIRDAPPKHTRGYGAANYVMQMAPTSETNQEFFFVGAIVNKKQANCSNTNSSSR